MEAAFLAESHGNRVHSALERLGGGPAGVHARGRPSYRPPLVWAAPCSSGRHVTLSDHDILGRLLHTMRACTTVTAKIRSLWLHTVLREQHAKPWPLICASIVARGREHVSYGFRVNIHDTCGPLGMLALSRLRAGAMKGRHLPRRPQRASVLILISISSATDACSNHASDHGAPTYTRCGHRSPAAEGLVRRRAAAAWYIV